MVSGKFSTLGGVGRYTSNLVHALRRHIDVKVICEKSNTLQDDSLLKVIQPGNYNNSNEILEVVQEVAPDLVHVQYEPSLFELGGGIINALSIKGSTLRKFYLHAGVPTVTTLHSVIPPEEYLEFTNQEAWRKGGKFSFLPISLRAYVRKWMYKKKYTQSFAIARLSDEVINASKTSYDLVGRGKIIYNAAEPAAVSAGSRRDLRKEFGLPADKMLLLAIGYATSAKGFDILSELSLPEGWAVVIKQTKYASYECNHPSQNVINLPLDYMDDERLSRLIHTCDAMIIPRKVAGSSSGVLFDGLSQGLPFVATNLKVFKEFADMGLGVVSERDPRMLSGAIKRLASSYQDFRKNVETFIPEIRIDTFASKHIEVYSDVLRAKESR
jgi:glycosyltransferase involved in cell wall biosynthesis